MRSIKKITYLENSKFYSAPNINQRDKGTEYEMVWKFNTPRIKQEFLENFISGTPKVW